MLKMENKKENFSSTLPVAIDSYPSSSKFPHIFGCQLEITPWNFLLLASGYGGEMNLQE